MNTCWPPLWCIGPWGGSGDEDSTIIDFNVAGGQSKNEARIATMKSYDACRACLMTPADKKAFPPPFSLKSGKYHGNQFVSLGGGANAPPWTVEMASIGKEEIEVFERTLRESGVRAHRVNEVDGHVRTLEGSLSLLNREEVAASPLDSDFGIVQLYWLD